jgi:hypothetical protein
MARPAHAPYGTRPLKPDDCDQYALAGLRDAGTEFE